MGHFATKLLFLLLLPLLLLTGGGCTTFFHHDRVLEKNAALKRQSDQLLKKLQPPPSRPRFRLHHKPWVSKRTVALPKQRLPSRYNRTITFATGTPMPLNEFSRLMSQLCGLPVRVTPDALAQLREKSRHQATEQSDQTEAMLTGIHWRGPLEGLLDTVSATLGLSWKYGSSGISLYYLGSRTFQIYAIPSDTEMKSTVQSGIDIGQQDNQGNGQSAQSTSVMLKSTLVRDIHRNIKSMLTPEVGHMSIATSTGSITVTDTPEVLEHIACYLQHENQTVIKQVLLNIKLLSLELTNTDQMGINWELILTQLNKGNPLRLLGLISAGTNASDGGSVKIIRGGQVRGGGQVDGAQFLLDALAQQGKISVITSPSVTTLNLQPVPVQVATQLSYVARTEVTKSKHEHSVALTPGMLTYGFNMNLLPFVMANNQLLLQYAINLSELVELKTFGKAGESQIQLPELNTRIFSQKVKLRSGETLVLSGFEQAHNSAQRQGAGSPYNWLLGGKIKAAQKRQVIVLMITPILLS